MNELFKSILEHIPATLILPGALIAAVLYVFHLRLVSERLKEQVDNLREQQPKLPSRNVEMEEKTAISIAQQVVLATPMAATSASGSSHRQRVLFVDDHKEMARLAVEILEMYGWAAVAKFNGADALKELLTQKVDVLVTDFRMDGMSGLDLIHEMRRHNINIPAIIVTGYNLVTSEAPVLPKEDIFPKLLELIRAYAPPANESGPSVNTGP